MKILGIILGILAALAGAFLLFSWLSSKQSKGELDATVRIEEARAAQAAALASQEKARNSPWGAVNAAIGGATTVISNAM